MLLQCLSNKRASRSASNQKRSTHLSFMATASLSTRPADGKDPGAVDNRLSLDPNDPRWKNKLSEWEDGERYPINIGGVKLEMEQMSPGEFEIVGGEAEEETDEEESAADEEPEPKTKSYGNWKMNRAVRGMMDEG